MSDGIWVIDPATNEPTLIPYDEIDPSVLPEILVPIGGFCYEAGQFVILPLPEVPFYITPWLPKQGKMMMYAPPKAGKSMAAMQMARCIGSGLPFLNLTTEQGRVLYLQFELGTGNLQYRMLKTGHKYNNVYVGTSFSMKLDQKDGQAQLQTAVEAIQPDVIILDPLYKVLNGEENESHDVLKVLNFLDAMIDTYKVSFITIHHSGKDIASGGRGSSVLRDWHDSVIEMRAEAQEGNGLSRVKMSPKFLRHAALPPEPITVSMENFEFVTVAARETVKDKVLAYMGTNDIGGGVKVGNIIDSGAGSNKYVHEALNELIEDGRVKQTTRGMYTLVQEV